MAAGSPEQSHESLISTLYNDLGGRAVTAFIAVAGAGLALQAGTANAHVKTPEARAYAADCTFGSSNYNPIACSKEGVSECINDTRERPYKFTAQLAEDSKRTSVVSIDLQEITGCNPLGARSVSVSRELRKGPTGKFAKDGKALRIFGNEGKNVTTRLVGSAVSCTAKMKDSAVEVFVTETWEPNKSHPVSKSKQTSVSYHTAPQRIC